MSEMLGRRTIGTSLELEESHAWYIVVCSLSARPMIVLSLFSSLILNHFGNLPFNRCVLAKIILNSIEALRTTRLTLTTELFQPFQSAYISLLLVAE